MRDEDGVVDVAWRAIGRRADLARRAAVPDRECEDMVAGDVSFRRRRCCCSNECWLLIMRCRLAPRGVCKFEALHQPGEWIPAGAFKLRYGRPRYDEL